jgi:hypothetical protein
VRFPLTRPACIEIELDTGVVVRSPLRLYPTLAKATRAQRSEARLMGRGLGIHWASLDLDLSIGGILLGVPERRASRRVA